MTFKKIRKRFFHFLINIGTSGKYRGERSFGMSDYLIRYVLMNFIIVTGFSILAVFAVGKFRQGLYASAAVISGMMLVALVSFILGRTKIPQIVPASMIMVFYGVMCVMLTRIGEAQGANFLFIYMYPPLTIMLLGMRRGVIFSVILVALVSLEMFVPGLSNYHYHFDVSIRMLVNYFLVFSVMVTIESTRNTKDRLIETQSRRLAELKDEAEAANHTKSSFLASMSHEIRTPMNAITGMAELLLRGELSDEARGYTQDIKQAGSNLISIINDILDISKIEAGKLEILPLNYLFASLLNDTVNIIRMRLMEKPIRFYTNIDGNIPNSLIGDEVRMRQIFLNLLSNAVKYTEKGSISMSVTVDKKVRAIETAHTISTDDIKTSSVSRDGKPGSGLSCVWLRITISDTGKGIKPEDQEKLFGDFVQVDARKNRGIEGTGLGLAIAKRLCRAMGGDIGVESEYGKGSAFTVVIPQGIASEVPFAVVEEPEKKKVLVYEGRSVYAKSVCWSLENMRVPYAMVANQNDFAEALVREEWFFVFSGYGLYDKIKPVMESAAFPGGKRPPLALMVEWGTEAYIPNVRFVSIPIQSLSIANVLNGRVDSKGYAEGSGAIRFTIPGVRLLVVDDIATNLKVAEGLLVPYKATVDICLSGAEAIELVKRRNYDIVFMDHMMPEIDGIEATAAIREWETEPGSLGIVRSPVPIIALTANAVSGMKEMFISKGFSDFLAKPIDVSKLDEMLDRWIPNEKKGKRDQEVGNRESGIGNGDRSSNSDIASESYPDSSDNTPRFLTIPGVDIQRGISLTGGKIDFYRRVLALFCKDAQERLAFLQTVPGEENITAFVTQVHALKSATASIGAEEVSAAAARLEAAGKEGDTALIEKELPAFTKRLAELAENIRAALETEGTDIAAARNEPPFPASVQLLRELETALQSQKTGDIDRILDELNGRLLDADMKAELEKISDEVLVAEYGKAGEILKSLFDSIGNTEKRV